MTGGVRLVMPDLLGERPGEALESAVLSLVQLGADRDQVELVPVGIFRRYRGVLLGQYPAPGAEVREGEPIRLYLAERALADRLPEGLLVQLPDEGRPETIFDAERGGLLVPEGEVPDGAPGRGYDPEELFRRQLDGGRQLLRVLDRALRRARRDMILARQALKFLVSEPRFARVLLDLLRLDALDSGDESAVFVAATLAGFQDAVGTLDEAAAYLAELFRVEMRAEEEPAGRLPIPGPLRLRLGGGNARLGRGTVPGRTFVDPRPGVVFRAGPMGAEAAAASWQDAGRHEGLCRAARAMVPASRPFRVVYEVERADRAARPGVPAHALLGRTMYLGAVARA